MLIQMAGRRTATKRSGVRFPVTIESLNVCQPQSSWFLKNSKFLQSICVIVLKFRKIGQTVAEIWWINVFFFKIAAVRHLGFVGRVLGPPMETTSWSLSLSKIWLQQTYRHRDRDIIQTCYSIVFTARCYASAVLAMALCPSVCVCLSQVGVLLKRLNVSSHKQTDSSFLTPKISAKFDRGHPLRGRRMQVGGSKSATFDQ